MTTIRKTIVRDDNECPVAVQIDYTDWLKIEALLANTTGVEPPISDLSAHRGCIKLTEDPMEFQLRIRGEWD